MGSLNGRGRGPQAGTRNATDPDSRLTACPPAFTTGVTPSEPGALREGRGPKVDSRGRDGRPRGPNRTPKLRNVDPIKVRIKSDSRLEARWSIVDLLELVQKLQTRSQRGKYLTLTLTDRPSRKLSCWT